MHVRRQLLVLALGLLLGLGFGSKAAFSTPPPVIVLTAFGTSTTAFATYQHLEDEVKKRFPGYEVRWAFTSTKVRDKVMREQHQELKDLPQTLQELKAAGYTRVAVQSLHLVPGEEWEEVVAASHQVPGLKIALGRPLLTTAADEDAVITALAPELPTDLKSNAVVLVGHGSPNPKGQAAFLDFNRQLRTRYAHQNVFFGLIGGEPGKAAALEAVRRSGATSVVLIPFLLVAGEHVNTDILGDNPTSWKSQLQEIGPCQVQGIRRGLGYEDGVVQIYLKHLDEALKTLTP